MMMEDTIGHALRLFADRRYDEAEALTGGIIDRDDGNTDAIWLNALSKFHLGRKEEALDMLTAAVAERPTSSNTYFLLGTVYEGMGRFAEAAACHAQALGLYPEHFKARDALERLGDVVPPDDGRWPAAVAPGTDGASLKAFAGLIMRAEPEMRDAVADSLVAANPRSSADARSPLSAEERGVIAQLRTDGIIPLANCLTPDRAGEIRRHLEGTPCFNAHVPIYSDRVGRYVGRGAEKFNFGSYSTRDVLQAPHVLETVLNPKILAVAEEYLGCVPTLYSVNSWWSFPVPRREGPQEFHRDLDDFRFISFFIFLTDVEPTTGPHLYLTGTHTLSGVRDHLAREGLERSPLEYFPPRLENGGYGRSGEFVEVFRGKLVKAIGPAGTGFIADTYGLHSGVKPSTGNRLVLWARYGVSPNWSYWNDRPTPVPRDRVADRLPNLPNIDHVTRLLIR